MNRFSRHLTVVTIVAAIVISLFTPRFAHAAAQTILNVSHDPTREFYQDYDVVFAKYWKTKTGDDLTVNVSNGGSGKQAARGRAFVDK